MSKFKKLLAAIIGLSVLSALKYFDVSLPGASDIVLELVVSALTAFGVYQLKNSDA